MVSCCTLQCKQEGPSFNHGFVFHCRGRNCRCGVDHCKLPHAEICGIDLGNEEDQTEFETLPLDELCCLGSDDDDDNHSDSGMTTLEYMARDSSYEEYANLIESW